QAARARGDRTGDGDRGGGGRGDDRRRDAGHAARRRVRDEPRGRARAADRGRRDVLRGARAGAARPRPRPLARPRARARRRRDPRGALAVALPIERPQKIVCVGLNYRDHAEEQGTDLPNAPLLFAKWPNTLIGPGDPIVLPAITSRVDYEAELGVVI